jgi:hypothetical protein
VLRSAQRRAPLLDALQGCDRLVLLGDAVELRHGPLRDALRAASELFYALGEAVGEVVLVPGNHDHRLAEPWFARRGLDGGAPPLGLEAAVDWHPGEPLQTIAGWLGAGRLRVSYPGVWLRDDVYATHGHYLDRHTTVPLLERLGAGAMARIVSESSGGPQCAEDYEATLAPIYAWIDTIAQHRGPNLGRSSHGPSARVWQAMSGPARGLDLRRRAMVAGFPLLVAALNRARLGPVRADLSGPELRRASLRAFGEVVRRLAVGAGHVIFGHTHRAGPLERDDRGEWVAPGGALMINSGSWVHEPGFLGRRPESSPYRPGFAVVVADAGPPELVNLLDANPAPA